MSFPVHPDQLSATVADGAAPRSRRPRPARRRSDEFIAKSIGDGVGLLGLVVRVELTLRPASDAGPATVVIKFAHPVDANRAIAMNTRMYEREVTFFTRIAAARRRPDAGVLRRPRSTPRPDGRSSCSRTFGATGSATRSRAAMSRTPRTSSTPSSRSTSRSGATPTETSSPRRCASTASTSRGSAPHLRGRGGGAVEMFGHCMTDYVRDGLERYIGIDPRPAHVDGRPHPDARARRRAPRQRDVRRGGGTPQDRARRLAGDHGVQPAARTWPTS